MAVVSNNVPVPDQVFHVSVEYEERKPKVEAVTTGRKRRMVQKATTNGDFEQQQQLINQYMSQIQTIQQLPSPTIPIIQPTTIIIDDKSTQDVTEEPKNNSTAELDEQIQLTPSKTDTPETTQKYDRFEIFGLFIANEMRALSSATIQRKLKRKILECVLEVTEGSDST